MRRRMLLLAVLLVAASGSARAQQNAPPKPEFPTGRTIRRVVTKHDPKQSYALYLPAAYDPARKWPVLFGFSPAARGTDPVTLFRSAAEKYGWIVVGSNNSRNGPFEPIQAAIEAVAKDVAARFSIDDTRCYSTGFSGGARVAFHMATSAEPPFAGVIPIGAGMARGQKPIEKGSKLAVFSLCGTGDPNHRELLRLEGALRALGLRQRMMTFRGGHAWAPPALCETAVRYLELLWRTDHGNTAEKATLDLLALERRDAEALLKADGHFMNGCRRFQELAALFKDADAGAAVAKRVAELEATDRHKKESAALDELTKLQAALAKVRDPAERVGKAVPLIRQFIDRHKGTDAAVRAQHSLASMAQYLVMAGFRLMQMKRYEPAAKYLAAARPLLPDSSNLAYNLACALALTGKKDEAVRALDDAVRLGFRNLEHIRNDADLDSLRDEPGYRKIIERLEKQPPNR